MSIWSTIAGWFQSPTGIPNLELVSNQNIYRGGQPSLPADWAYLRSLGVSNVVKLNLEPEGDPEMPVYAFPVTTEQQLLGTDLAIPLHQAVAIIQPGTFVHCEHGQDRTGLVVAMWRVVRCGWSKDAAQQEMLDLGFHKELVGLWAFWQNWSP